MWLSFADRALRAKTEALQVVSMLRHERIAAEIALSRAICKATERSCSKAQSGADRIVDRSRRRDSTAGRVQSARATSNEPDDSESRERSADSFCERRSNRDPNLVGPDRVDRSAQARACPGDGARRPRARRIRPPVQGLCGDRAGRQRRARSAPAARRARGARRPGPRPRGRAGAQGNGGRRGRGDPPQAAARRARAGGQIAAARRRRRPRGDARGSRRDRRRRGRVVRRRPAAHVPALRRRAGLEVRIDQRQRGRAWRLQGSDRLDQRAAACSPS